MKIVRLNEKGIVVVQMIFCLIMVIFGLGLAYMSFDERAAVKQAEGWSSTRGIIKSVDVKVVSSKHGRWMSRSMTVPVIKYNYEVEGVAYPGNTLSLATFSSAITASKIKDKREIMTKRNEKGEAKRGRLFVGQEVEVYYNPENPGEAILYPKASSGRDDILLGGGFGLAIIAALGAVISFFKKRKI